jgi:ATP-dependent Lhr-like helicase
LDSVSPLSVPILLEIGKEAVAGFAREELLREAAAELAPRATLEETQCSS